MSDALDHGLQRREASLIAPIDLDKAVFLSLWMEAILYGVFLVLFVGTIYALVYKRSTERVNRPMLYTACTILLLATAHLCLDLVRCLQAFIDAPRAGSSALAYFANIAHPTHMAKTSVLVTETYVADGLLVYRLYVVWMRNVWIAIIPCLLVISTAISGYAATYMLGQLAGTGASVFAVELRQWITSFFTITLSNNVLCTLLIAYRIWSTHKGFEAGGSLNSVIQVVVESGAIYSAALIIQIIVYLLGSNAQYAVLDPLSPLIGIVFSLIIIRVAMGLSHGGSGHGRHTSGTQQRSLSVFQAQSQPHSVHPMKPLAVQVTQGVHSHSDPATVADISHSMSTNKTLGGGYSDDDLEFTSQMPKGRAY